jgi:hypothetical protein
MSNREMHLCGIKLNIRWFPREKFLLNIRAGRLLVAQLNSVTLRMPPLLPRGGGWIVEHIILPLCYRTLINWPAQPHYLHPQVFRTCLRAISLAGPLGFAGAHVSRMFCHFGQRRFRS